MSLDVRRTETELGAEERAHGLKHWLFFQTQRGSQRCVTPVPAEPMASSDLCRHQA